MNQRIPDNYDAWQAHDAAQAAKLEELPVCDSCDEPIQDGYYYKIGGRIMCESCVDFFFRRDVG